METFFLTYPFSNKWLIAKRTVRSGSIVFFTNSFWLIEPSYSKILRSSFELGGILIGFVVGTSLRGARASRSSCGPEFRTRVLDSLRLWPRNIGDAITGKRQKTCCLSLSTRAASVLDGQPVRPWNLSINKLWHLWLHGNSWKPFIPGKICPGRMF